MAELQIKASAEQGILSFNKEELEKAIKQELKKYEIKVTEDNIQEAKELKARLNKVSKNLDDKRKEIKNRYCIPLDKFESDVNSVKDLVVESSDKIKSQLDVFEQSRIKEKQLEITEYYTSLNFELISLDKIFDTKWLNKGCTDWKEQIDSIIERINQELDILNSFDLSQEEKLELKGYYLDCLNVTTARTRFDEQKQRREALKKMQEEQSQQQASQPQQSVATDTCRDEIPKEVEQVMKQRIVAEFISTRPFFDEMNELIKKYKAQVKIMEREGV